MEIRTIEIAGFASALTALRLPYGKEVRSKVKTELPNEDAFIAFDHVGYGADVYVNEKDLTLMSTLVKRGDEHAKVVRGIIVWAEIKAPVYLYRELETYRFGRERLASNSTMHQECRTLTGHELQKAKAEIPMGLEQTTVDAYSYQALRRLIIQRYDHRLPEWHTIIDWVRALPLADKLILVGLEDKLAVHDEYMRKYNANEI